MRLKAAIVDENLLSTVFTPDSMRKVTKRSFTKFGDKSSTFDEERVRGDTTIALYKLTFYLPIYLLKADICERATAVTITSIRIVDWF